MGEVDPRWTSWVGSRERGMVFWGGQGEVCKGEEERTKRGIMGLPSFSPFLSAAVRRESDGVVGS